MKPEEVSSKAWICDDAYHLLFIHRCLALWCMKASVVVRIFTHFFVQGNHDLHFGGSSCAPGVELEQTALDQKIFRSRHRPVVIAHERRTTDCAERPGLYVSMSDGSTGPSCVYQ